MQARSQWQQNHVYHDEAWRMSQLAKESRGCSDTEGTPDIQAVLPVPRPRVQAHPVVAEKYRAIHMMIPAHKPSRPVSDLV